MKPLAIVTSWNRLELTKRMLTSLEPSLDALQTVIVDNGSDQETVVWLTAWACHKDVELITLPQNIGCPRALNVALKYRLPGQAVIKFDNDILLSGGPEWVEALAAFAQECEAVTGIHLAMMSAYYQPWEQQRVTASQPWRNATLFTIRPVVGHAVYHAGPFVDRVGFFDVLAPEHLYGFEDLLLSHKASALEFGMYAWTGWSIQNIQRHSAIGSREELDAHVAAMRPLYNERASMITPKRVYTASNGELQ